MLIVSRSNLILCVDSFMQIDFLFGSLLHVLTYLLVVHCVLRTCCPALMFKITLCHLSGCNGVIILDLVPICCLAPSCSKESTRHDLWLVLPQQFVVLFPIFLHINYPSAAV